MTTHIHGVSLTHEGTFSNNRGENEGGNTNTLQKVVRNGDLFTTVSAESIRYALRDGWQQADETLNRTTLDHSAVKYEDSKFKDWKKFEYLDDDVLGFMHAADKKDGKEGTISRRAPMEVTRAISLTPWTGEIMHNFASPGSSGAGKAGNPIPYAVEVHHTRYQFGFALTPEALGRASNGDASVHDDGERIRRVGATLNGIANLRRVGGAHARYLGDYSPEVLILRVTTDPAPRMLYCFEDPEGIGDINVGALERKLGKDVDPEELIVGAAVDISELRDLETDDGGRVLTEGPWKGAVLTGGVKDAVTRCVERLKGEAS